MSGRYGRGYNESTIFKVRSSKKLTVLVRRVSRANAEAQEWSNDGLKYRRLTLQKGSFLKPALLISRACQAQNRLRAKREFHFHFLGGNM